MSFLYLFFFSSIDYGPTEGGLDEEIGREEGGGWDVEEDLELPADLVRILICEIILYF